MKKIVLIGRSEAGKTTLTQAMKGEKIEYHKTQYVNNFDVNFLNSVCITKIRNSYFNICFLR